MQIPEKSRKRTRSQAHLDDAADRPPKKIQPVFNQLVAAYNQSKRADPDVSMPSINEYADNVPAMPSDFNSFCPGVWKDIVNTLTDLHIQVIDMKDLPWREGFQAADETEKLQQILALKDTFPAKVPENKDFSHWIHVEDSFKSLWKKIVGDDDNIHQPPLLKGPLFMEAFLTQLYHVLFHQPQHEGLSEMTLTSKVFSVFYPLITLCRDLAPRRISHQQQFDIELRADSDCSCPKNSFQYFDNHWHKFKVDFWMSLQSANSGPCIGAFVENRPEAIQAFSEHPDLLKIIFLMKFAHSKTVHHFAPCDLISYLPCIGLLFSRDH